MTDHKKENAYTGCSPLVRVFTPNPISKKPSVSQIIAPAAAAALKKSRNDKKPLSSQEFRMLKALIAEPIPLERLAAFSGAGNSLNVAFISMLRRRGFAIHGVILPCKDRYGISTEDVVYTLCQSSRQKALETVRVANGKT